MVLMKIDVPSVFVVRWLNWFVIVVGLILFCEIVTSPAIAESSKLARWHAPKSISKGTAKKYKDLLEKSKKLAHAKKSLASTTEMPLVKGGAKQPARNLVVSYAKPEDSAYEQLAADLKESKGIDIIVKAVNETFDFPRIKVVFDMCGEDNAYYDSESRRIILCYELVAALAEGFRQNEDLTDEEVGAQVTASLIFTFFHELGHAAIDVFDLPLMGNEEDAADRFATLILLSGNSGDDDEEDLADSAIGSFDLETAESLEDLDFGDEHPVDEQRWYTMACLMVGSDPVKYDYLVGENGLSEERAESCPAEYEKISKSWQKLLAPHLRKT